MGSVVYSFLLALWAGGMFIFTFLVTPVIFQSFGRDTAGEIVGKLFPYYFPYTLTLCSRFDHFSFVFGYGGISGIR